MSARAAHRDFIVRCITEETRSFYLTESMRISTFYWALGSLFLLEEHKKLNSFSARVGGFVAACQNPDGGFGGRPGYPSCAISTLSALQILYLIKRNKEIVLASPESAPLPQEEAPCEKMPSQFTIRDREEELLNLQTAVESTGLPPADAPSGAEFPEKSINYVLCNAYLESIVTNEKLVGYDSILDIRQICCYVSSKNLLSLLALGGPEMFFVLTPMKKMLCNYISQCINIDGGLGVIPGCESHATYNFCGLSALFLMGEMSCVYPQETAMSISLLQAASGGLSGRPDRIEEICSTYWNYSSLAIMGKESYVDGKAVLEYISSCESPTGGYSDRPGESPNLLHTLYALACKSIAEHKIVMEILPTLSFCLFE
ncbi:geranylgeranyl transferase type-2 subunit beta [Nematocida major]|uniref:geranylgeranyl transferase type-2 subunit beta n=1 Tax=Nematocida major TaxID=1912982 RepID=UPI0020072A61|nr:geranylgeranyl transferase type-2 subunit beta [Nematocida major]KAH9386784.1 geranylgeranyl transferase type-2 subunit beta [Nematocida major]